MIAILAKQLLYVYETITKCLGGATNSGVWKLIYEICEHFQTKPGRDKKKLNTPNDDRLRERKKGKQGKKSKERKGERE